MPTYEYECRACSHRYEVFQGIKEGTLRKCPECSRLQLRRIIGTGGGIIFKGSGFYQTDYRSSSYTEGKQKDTQAGSTPKSDKPESKPDSSAGSSSSNGSGDSKGDGGSAGS